MELKIKDSLESIKIYGRYLSEFLLPDQIDILAKSLQKDIEQKLTLTDVVKPFYCLDEVHRGREDKCKQQCDYCERHH
tara:strand:- start:1767 stop:2000 length:234 start_codon:yes stop_codon:yes gene_type:complete